MNKVLQDAIKRVGKLSRIDQQKIGHGLLAHVEKLQQLRVETDRGLRSLDVTRGKKFDLKRFLKAKVA